MDKGIFTLKSYPLASWAACLVTFECSGLHFLLAGSGQPVACTGKSPAKSEPVIFLLLAPGCLCFRLKGMGGISLPSPF